MVDSALVPRSTGLPPHIEAAKRLLVAITTGEILLPPAIIWAQVAFYCCLQ
jgi:hypothetical protein